MSQADSLPWANVVQSWGHPWHSMCSYLGAFPAAMARGLIVLFTNPGEVVLDPFCGRGTTLLEARLVGRVPLASDLNPIAVALTRAKNVDIDLPDVLARIEELEKGFDLALYLAEAYAQDDTMMLIYHPHTLAKLCYLRRRLIPPTSMVDEFLVGAVLGIMHGAERQDGTSSYASISMPNTFSMPPDYVRRFVQDRGLRRVDRDVFRILRDKALRLLRSKNVFRSRGRVVCADAKILSRVEEFRDYAHKVDLVLTSPPYLNVINYALQNWIRMWFIGEDPRTVAEQLDDNLTIGAWLSLMERVVGELRTMVAPDGAVVMVVGDVVRSRTSVLTPARELIRRLHHLGWFGYIGCVTDRLNVEEKTTRIWKETKGRATLVDRILVLANNEPRMYVQHIATEFGQVPFNALMLSPATLADNAKAYAGLP